MRRVKEVLRLAHELGYSHRQIAVSVRLGRTAVGEYLERAREAGIRYADVAEMSEAAVETLLFKCPEPRSGRPMPDWDAVAAEMRRPGVTLLLLWQEYREQQRDGYSYSQYHRHFRAHQRLLGEPRLRRTPAPALPSAHAAGCRASRRSWRRASAPSWARPKYRITRPRSMR